MLEIGLRMWQTFNDLRYVNTTERQVGEMEALSRPIPDSMLGLRLPPYTGGHDAKGWRNESAPDRVEIVAIGDSQTWGINVDRSEAWPQTLAKLSGRSVYNMGLGFYGPVQYWVLLDEALEFSPQVIVIGLYFGNDIYNAYQTVYTIEAHAQFRNPKASDELLNDTVATCAEALNREQEQFQSHRLLRYSALFRALQTRGIWGGTLFQLDKAWAMAYPEHGAIYEQGDTRTVFTPAYRLLALDLTDPRIIEGLRITKEMLLKMKARMGQANVRLLVLLIPTKETVYTEVMNGNSEAKPGETYVKLVTMEEQVHDEIIKHCQEYQIECVDALPILRQAVLNNEQIYPEGTDGHPITRGYFLIASAIQDALSKIE